VQLHVHMRMRCDCVFHPRYTAAQFEYSIQDIGPKVGGVRYRPSQIGRCVSRPAPAALGQKDRRGAARVVSFSGLGMWRRYWELGWGLCVNAWECL
jgi:hypothetical protein